MTTSAARIENLPAWMRRQMANGAVLATKFPDARDAVAQQWLGERWYWWPQGVPTGRWVGVASSRLGRKLDERDAWFRALRAICAKLDPARDLLVTAAATSSAPFVARAAALFGCRLLQMQVADENQSLDAWLAQLETASTIDASPQTFPLFVSPPLERPSDGLSVAEVAASMAKLPGRDRALVALSDRLLVTHVRAGGQLHELLRQRLQSPLWPVASVQVALGDQLVSPGLRDELLSLGAVGWLLLDAPENSVAEPTQTLDAQAGHQIIACPPGDAWCYLTHCTRRRFGPWPDETETEFLNALVLSEPTARHAPQDALLRIVERQRLLASTAAIRGGHAVVSFTSVPLPDLVKRRTFRPHRGRWDFEPYGICVARDWLQQFGVRPVEYGDDGLWSRMSAADQPFFQKRCSTRGDVTIDWSLEQEWRVLGDVDLASLPNEAAFLFVPTFAEAQPLAAVSRFPVVALDAERGSVTL